LEGRNWNTKRTKGENNNTAVFRVRVKEGQLFLVGQICGTIWTFIGLLHRSPIRATPAAEKNIEEKGRKLQTIKAKEPPPPTHTQRVRERRST